MFNLNPGPCFIDWMINFCMDNLTIIQAALVIDFYIDGIKRWTSTKAIPKRDMQIALHMYTIDTWEEVQYPPKGEILQITDWVEYRKFKE